MRQLCFLVVATATLLWGGPSNGQQIDPKMSTRCAPYRCCKIKEKIVVDGKLTETCWSDKPVMLFRGLEDGSEPILNTHAKIIWDDRYLYVGFDITDPDVWSRCGLRDNECREEFVERCNTHASSTNTEWHRLECDIMKMDKFVKVFLDPDGDGKDYVEFHVNPMNNVFDAWYKQGFRDTWGDRERSPDVKWSCPGLVTATHMRGTLNASHDRDEGWSVEIAIPWKALAAFTKGACPPRAGDTWTAHLGRVHKDRFMGANIYWMWPVIGQINCHLPNRYGKLIFSEMTKRFVSLAGWGGGDPEEVVPKAADIGFTEIIAFSGEPAYLEKLANVAKKHQMDVYGTVNLDAHRWKHRYRDQVPPLQQMNERENAERVKLTKEDYRREKNYQWGGEPVQPGKETLVVDMLCFHDDRVKTLLKEHIREIVAVRGIKGVAFDGFGYQNYRSCLCPHSMRLLEKYHKQHNELSPEKAAERFSLKTLVSLTNELSDYARSIKPDIKIACHIWPVFEAEPLYGNRLDVDYCGQTAAWYFPWDLAKVRSYARVISGDAKKYYRRANGVAFLGFFDRSEKFPGKSVERIEAELKAILDGGCDRVQVCSVNDVIKSPAIANVFRKYFKQDGALQTP